MYWIRTCDFLIGDEVDFDGNIDFDEKMQSLQTEFSKLLEKEEQSKKRFTNPFLKM